MSQEIATKKPIRLIIILELNKFNFFGDKLIKVNWLGIKFATKFVDADPKIINIKAITVMVVLSNLPIISVGFVKILTIALASSFRKISEPIVMNTAKKENII